MNTVLTAPFTLEREEIRSQLAIKPGSNATVVFEELLKQVEEIANPKALFRVSYIEARQKDTVTIEDITFHSQAMSTNLAKIGRVFPFVATCGTEVDEIPIDQEDVLKQYWLNAIKLALLHASLEHLRQTLQNRYRLENLSAMNPGSGAASVWPIEEQSLLFALFGGVQIINQEIGVHLLPSYLMVPDMTVSGILFPSETSYYNCQLCQREDCPGRQAHFDANLWESVQKGD
jgi:hypothetical protein